MIHRIPFQAALPALAMLVALSAPAAASPLEHGTGLVAAAGHAFTLTAPQGWLMDNETGVQQGLATVFYPDGDTWAESPVVAYAHMEKKRGPGITPDDLARQKVAKMRGHGNTNVASHKQAPIPLAEGEAVVYHFDGYNTPYFEALAYVDGPDVIATIAFGARTREQFDAGLAAFAKLVKSYDDVSEAPAPLSAEAFAKLKAEAGAIAATDEGHTYEGKLIGHFTPAIRSHMTGCMMNLDAAEISDFEMVFEVDPEGGVHDTHVQPESPLAVCFERQSRHAHHPAHHFSHYIQHINMHIPK